MKVLVAGELNPDLIFSGLTSFPQPGREVLAQRLSMQLGSSSAIFAAGMAKLGNDVAFIGKVGADEFGRFSLGQLERSGVDATHVIVDEQLTTGVTVSISGADRALMTYSGAIATLSPGDIPRQLLERFEHLHVASYYLQQALQPGLRKLFALARDIGVTVSLDPGCDPAGRWARTEIRELLSFVDVFLADEIELAGLSGASGVEAGLRKLDRDRTRIVAKLGERGCATLDGGRLLQFAALAIDAVDTTGAGDSFDAGFLHAWLRGLPLNDCLRCGTICGGLSTRSLGGASSQPGWGEVEDHWDKLNENSVAARRP